MGTNPPADEGEYVQLQRVEGAELEGEYVILRTGSAIWRPQQEPLEPTASTSQAPEIQKAGLWKTIHYQCYYNLVPFLFLLTTPLFVQLLAFTGQHDFDFDKWMRVYDLYGNGFSWSAVGIMFIWAIFWLKIPGDKSHGPPTLHNYVPEYQDNGFMYYLVTIFAFITTQVFWRNLSSQIFWNMPAIISTLNIVAFVFCVYLYGKGLFAPQQPTDLKGLTELFVFYSGIEINPTIFGMQVKQLTNSRFGLMVWQLLVLAFFVTGYQRNGFNLGFFTNCLLQTIYLAKFFWSESWYYWTLDIVHDHAGYYICWGCLVLVPAFYTYSSYYLVLHPPIISDYLSIAILIFGLLSIAMNYRVDYEKLLFQKNRLNDDFKLWGKKVRYIEATYTDWNGEIKETRLLASGCWGVARHLNYLFELFLALAWALPGIGLGIHSFGYFIFLFVLLVHRCFRDEERCRKKYGNAYKQYCKKVPYRMIPYLF